MAYIQEKIKGKKIVSFKFKTCLGRDANGKQMSSMEFAKWVQARFNSGVKNVNFVIGGPYGFSDAVYSRADSKISLSKMTFSHQMVRAIFAEQIYRAFTIMRGEPYHHE